jgi:preprotein translocase subunit SecD
MMKEKITAIFFVFIVIILCGVIIFPKSFNKSLDLVTEKTALSLPKVKELSFNLGLDLEGGAYLLYQADLEDIPGGEKNERMEGLRDLIEKRVNLYGISESSVRIREERLEVEIPGEHNLEDAIEVIGETPFLDFRESSEELFEEKDKKWKEIEEYFGKKREEIALQDIFSLEEGEIEGWEVITEPHYQPTGLTGRHLESARVVINQVSQKPLITLEFNEEGAALFEEITARNIGRPVATFIDDEMVQEATVQEKITGGKAQITGDFSAEEAYQTARDLQIGALPVPISLISQQSIGPELGAKMLEFAIKAGLVGAVLVAVFMILFYRLAGLVSVLSLFVYSLLLISLFKVIVVTLTLSGIAGFILSIGMAIDANVLVLSRMREELKKGRGVAESIEEGYLKAWSSIRDGNITTLIVAFVIFFITTSFVRGFAVVLIMGIIVSIFSVMVINRILLRILSSGRLSKIKKIWV